MAKQKPQWYGYIYLLQCGEFFKIGFSLTPRKRIQQLRTGSPHPIVLIHELRTSFYKMIEKQLHYKFRTKRVKGEWFALNTEDIAHIKSLNTWGHTPEEQQRRDEGEARYRAMMNAEQKAEEDRQLSVLLSGLAAGAGLCLDIEDAASMY